MPVERVNVEGLGRLRAFSHAVISEGWVFVSGTLGTTGATLELVDGGVAAETTQALSNVQRILAACGCRLHDVVKVTVYLSDMSAFDAMNRAYAAVLGDAPPARMTVPCLALALGASVEIECVARRTEMPQLGIDD